MPNILNNYGFKAIPTKQELINQDGTNPVLIFGLKIINKTNKVFVIKGSKPSINLVNSKTPFYIISDHKAYKLFIIGKSEFSINSTDSISTILGLFPETLLDSKLYLDLNYEQLINKIKNFHKGVIVFIPDRQDYKN